MQDLAFNPGLDGTHLSIFEPIVAQLKRVSAARKVIPLHQGKTAFTTPVAPRDWAPDEFEFRHYHDGPTSGTSALLQAIAESHGGAIDVGRIQVTAGITHALSIAFHEILRPGDEVLILSPQWLFATGLVLAAGGVAREVPFFLDRETTFAEKIRDVFATKVSPRTRALYFNTPNNPTGYALGPEDVALMVELARSKGLWLVSDNAYSWYDYSPCGFVDPGTLDLGRDITFSCYSFSKSFGLTGYRIGYLVSPPASAERSRKYGLYSIYSTPTVCQFVALSALKLGPAIIENNRALIRQALGIVKDEIDLPFTEPEGGFYTLLDLSSWEPGVDDFVARCIEAGVSLAPGAAFGASARRHARLCFSVVGHDDLREGIAIVNDVHRRGY